MPRDSHMLSETTQALLREARRPRLAKRKDPLEDEKGDDDEEGEKEIQTGFLAKKWSQVPAHLEEPEREYLAKRRKGLPSLHAALALQAAANIPVTAATRKAKVMKSDGHGNTTIYEVLVPEGQVVEGEIKADAEISDATLERAAPGTVIEGVGVANQEGIIVANDLLQSQPIPRRRNMPPKRIKKGGPGRGRKKVMFTAEGQTASSTPGGISAPAAPAVSGAVAVDAMDVDSVPKEGEDGGDDEGEEEEDEDEDREDGELSDGEADNNETSFNLPGAHDTALPAEVAEADAEDGELPSAANGDAMEDVQSDIVIAKEPISSTEAEGTAVEPLAASNATQAPTEATEAEPVVEEQTETEPTPHTGPELELSAEVQPEAQETQDEAQILAATWKESEEAATRAEVVINDAPEAIEAGSDDEDYSPSGLEYPSLDSQG